MKVLGNLPSGLTFIVSAPAGTGKTTLVKMLKEEFDCVAETISYTTRSPRPGEQDGIDYHFIKPNVFEEKIRAGEFLEYAEVFGYHYGTSLLEIERLQKTGQHVVLIIDTQGALQLKSEFEAAFIFIHPPSVEELKKRLKSRKADSKTAIETRLSWAEKEIQEAANYDYQLINTSLKITYDVFRSIFIAEEHKNRCK